MSIHSEHWYVLPLINGAIIAGLSGAIFFGAVRKHRAQRRSRRVGRL